MVSGKGQEGLHLTQRWQEAGDLLMAKGSIVPLERKALPEECLGGEHKNKFVFPACCDI